jgi:uncharacterized membrane protein (DUF4010 family)
VLPLLPDKPIGPYGALNLRTVWTIVILVMAVSALGYIAVRLVGPRYGLPLAGLASGFVSSSATIGAMGTHAKAEPELMKPAVAGAVLSSVATVVQLVILIAATDMSTLQALWLPLILSGVTAVLYGGAFTLWALKEQTHKHEAQGNAFSLATALAFAAILAVVLLAAAAAQDWFGEAGVLVAAAAAGFADTHSAAVSVASLVSDGAGGLHHQHCHQDGLRHHRRWPRLRALRHPRPAADAGSGLGRGRGVHRLSVRTD